MCTKNKDKGLNLQFLVVSIIYNTTASTDILLVIKLLNYSINNDIISSKAWHAVLLWDHNHLKTFF